MQQISFSAQIDGVNAKKDRTLSLRLGTQELTTDDTAHIFDLMGKQIFIAIGETPIESMEIPEVLPEMKGDKSPSQRLRGILFKIWEQKYPRGVGVKDKSYISFPKFYEDYMFKLCESLKEKIT